MEPPPCLCFHLPHEQSVQQSAFGHMLGSTIFSISDTILQVHVFADPHETEVEKQLFWVDQNNKKYVGFFPLL